MQQDPSSSSSWNKSLLYPTQSESSSSSSSSTATSAAQATTATVAPAATTSAQATNSVASTVPGSSVLPVPNIHSRSTRSLPGTANPSASASTPCLTSSHIRPNVNLNSDVVAIHQSFDLSKPSPSTSAPLSPVTHGESIDIDAVLAYRSQYEQLSNPASPQVISPPQTQPPQKRLQYESTSSNSLRGLTESRMQHVDTSAGGEGVGLTWEQEHCDTADMTEDSGQDVSWNYFSKDTTGDPTSAPMDRTLTAPPPSRPRYRSVQTLSTTTADVEYISHRSRCDHERPHPDGVGDQEQTSLHQEESDLHHVRVRSNNMQATATSSVKDVSLKSRMSPADTYHLSSSISSSSTRAKATSAKSAPASAASSSPSTTASTSTTHLTTSSLPSSTIDSSALSSLETLSTDVWPSSLDPIASSEQPNTFTDTGVATSLAPDLSSGRQQNSPASSSSQINRPQIEPGRRTIYLPHFLSGIRPLTVQGPRTEEPQSSSVQRDQGHNSQDAARSHTVVTVTDVCSINFRDISTVPTLTTFGHKRSKRRKSSTSHNSSSASVTTSSHPSTSRRKKAKKSSSSASAPLNSCISCGCIHPHGPSADCHTAKSLSLAEQEQASNLAASSGLSMKPTGGIRSQSESDTINCDAAQPSHHLEHQRRRRRNQEHQQRLEQQDNHQSIEQVPVQHHQHQPHLSSSATSLPSSPLSLQSSQVTRSHQGHSTLKTRPQLRVQIRQERDLSPLPYPKRQRSPQFKSMPSGSSVPSSSTSVDNMERLKRARHQSSADQNQEVDVMSNLKDDRGMDQDMSWEELQDSEQYQTSQQENAPVQTNGIKRQSRRVALQIQQPSSWIHPMDNESTNATEIQSSATSSNAPSENFGNSPPSGTQLIRPLNASEHTESTVHTQRPMDAKTQHAASTINRTSERKDDVSLNMSSENGQSITQVSRDEELVIQPQRQPSTTVQELTVGPKEAAAPSTSTRDSSSVQSPKPGRGLSTTSSPSTLMLPITRETLRELDLLEIFKSPQIRHDIVFDPHLQFRPNFDGERGLMKRREADRFWREVGVELNTRRKVLATRREATTSMLSLAGLSSSNGSSRLIQQQAQQMCPLPKAILLPRLIDELREILLSLLPAPPAAAATTASSNNQDGNNPAQPPPNPERALLMSTLDPDMLLQELDHGVLDVHALFRFLGGSLKGHCAPMRDALVESMVNIVVDGDEIVRGIRMCFEILEWMKLDIANHQLRTLRPWLLDNSVDFEQKYFTEYVARGGTILRTREWFKRSWLHWVSVKQSVLGKSSSHPATAVPAPVPVLVPMQSSSPSRQASLAPPCTTASTETEASSISTGQKRPLSPGLSVLSAKRRSSIVSADIGENILDGVVNEGLLGMILKPSGSIHDMPETFELDHYRLVSFHNDFQDLTILCTLLILFRQLAQNYWTQQDLVEIKKVAWLLLTDENANFGANTNTGSGSGAGSGTRSASAQMDKTGVSSGSSGMKDIVIQIEFAARKVRERGMHTPNATATTGPGSRRSSPVPETPLPSMFAGQRRGSSAPPPIPAQIAEAPKVSTPVASLSTLTLPSIGSASSLSGPNVSLSSLSASDTNLLTAWLDNALCRTSTLYQLIQKRLLIHFRRWLYFHSSSSMMVISASCASLASSISMSSAMSNDDEHVERAEEDEDGDGSNKDRDPSNGKEGKVGKDAQSESSQSTPPTPTVSVNGQPVEKGVASVTQAVPASVPVASKPELSPEEAKKAAAETLASKLSFDAVEMETHGLTGLEDEMVALLEKIRAVTEFNKKVYGSWYCDLIKEGRTENWLDKASSSSVESI